GEEPDATFHFRWEEFNTSELTRRPDSDFGLILLDRVAPEALGGTAKRYFTEVSYVYELVAPMATVVDMTERDRTEQFAAPARRRGQVERARHSFSRLLKPGRGGGAGRPLRLLLRGRSAAAAAHDRPHRFVGAEVLGAVDIEQRRKLRACAIDAALDRADGTA